jgi:fructose-1,6-bisphosphatase/inositol monophosphatase family enzyme
MQSALLEQLGRVLREVAQAEIVARFQKLAPNEVISKATTEDPLDLVTAADRAAEAALTIRLQELVPNSTVVGEEAVAADPGVLERIREAAPVWIVDPLDGTKNFAAGHGPFGTMVALVERGTLLAAGIYLPLSDRNFLAERGLGTFVDGVRIAPRAAATGVLSGTAYSRFMPEDASARLMARAARVHADRFGPERLHALLSPLAMGSCARGVDRTRSWRGGAPSGWSRLSRVR